MTQSKTNHILLTGLSCEIIDHSAAIRRYAAIHNKGLLYEKFVQNFLSYVPVDYAINDNLELLCSFANEAFEYFRKRPTSSQVVKIIKGSQDANPVMTIVIITEDKPFIVDSITSLLSRLGISTKYMFHPVLHTVRLADGSLEDIVDKDSNGISAKEAVVYVQLFANFDEQKLDKLTSEINLVLDQVQRTALIWGDLLENLDFATKSLTENIQLYDSKGYDTEESIAFLKWLKDNHFTFLGSFEFDFANKDLIVEKLGAWKILEDHQEDLRNIIKLSRDGANADKLTVLAKINTISLVHKNSLIDSILIKKLDSNGDYKGGTLIFGLYGTAIYYQSVKDIPILRKKLEFVLKKSGFEGRGFNYKKLKILLESMPREALIHMDASDLYFVCFQMLSSLISKKPKVFVLQEATSVFVNILVFIPKNRLTAEVHNRLIQYLS